MPMVGIGVTIRLENEDDAGFTVASVTPGGPAEAAGLQIGDMLLAIDGANMKELGMEEARNRVRGEEGTSLTLTVQRGVETFDVTVTRATIEVEVVRAELLDGNVGYLKINNFDSGLRRKVHCCDRVPAGSRAQRLCCLTSAPIRVATRMSLWSCWIISCRKARCSAPWTIRVTKTSIIPMLPVSSCRWPFS